MNLLIRQTGRQADATEKSRKEILKDNLRLTELVKNLSQQKDALCLH